MSWRDARQRAALIGSFFGGFSVLPFLAFGDIGDKAVYIVAVVAFFQGSASTNVFGFDGRAYWMNVAAGAGVDIDLRGKAAARAAILALVCVPLALGIAAASGSWADLMPALGIAAAAAGVATGGGLWVSVSVPVPMPEDRGNVFSAGNPGQGMQAMLPSMLLLLASAAAMLPFVVAVILAGDHPLGRSAIAAAGVTVGVAGYRAGLALATRRARDRQPELLAALDPRT